MSTLTDKETLLERLTAQFGALKKEMDDEQEIALEWKRAHAAAQRERLERRHQVKLKIRALKAEVAAGRVGEVKRRRGEKESARKAREEMRRGTVAEAIRMKRKGESLGDISLAMGVSRSQAQALVKIGERHYHRWLAAGWIDEGEKKKLVGGSGGGGGGENRVYGPPVFGPDEGVREFDRRNLASASAGEVGVDGADDVEYGGEGDNEHGNE